MKRVLAMLFATAVFVVLGASVASATPSDVCPSGGGWVKVEPLSGLTYTYTAPAGYLVAETCYKASTTVVYATVSPPASPVTVTSTVWNKDGCPGANGCNYQELSHASFRLVDAPVVTPPPTDLCSNLEGIQETMPTGYEDPDQDGVCTLIPPPPTDLCTNLEGVQTVMPQGYEDPDQDGVCTLIPPPTDVCPNLEGVQETVPAGLIIDDEGNCVEPPVEVCPYNPQLPADDPLCVPPPPPPPPPPPACNPDKKIWVWTLFDANGIAYTLRDLHYDGTYDAPGVAQQCYYFGCDFVAVKAWGRWVGECDSDYAYWRTLPSGAGGGKCPLPEGPSQ